MNRRQAISTIGLVSGSALLPASCSVREAGKRQTTTFYYSLNTSTISGQTTDIQKQIEIASEAGYDYIEVWVRDVEASLANGCSTASLRKLLEDHKLRIASAIGFAPWMTGGKKGFSQMEREMNILAEIGCPRIAAPPAGVDADHPPDLLAMGEKYAELLDLGRRTGVMPQLEFWGATKTLWHMGQVLMIIAAADDPDVKILPDVYHMYRGKSGFNSLKVLNGNMIDVFHLNDYPADIPRQELTDADRIYPGDGVAPYKQILEDLKAMGGDKILSLELFNRKYWKEDALTVAKTGLKKMKAVVEKIA